MTNSRLLRAALAGIALCTFGSGCGNESGNDTGAGASSGSGGSGASGSGGTSSTGGTAPTGSGGVSAGGSSSGGAASGSGGKGGTSGAGGAGGTGGEFNGTCTASEAAGRNVSGSGDHDVVVETNSDPKINEGTIFRPADLGPGKSYPIVVWGQGGCSRNGLSTEAGSAEIASHGYFVIADGTPGGTEPNRPLGGGGDVLLAYIDWAIAENSKPCSAYYQSLDTTKIDANGFSCGGLMAAGTAADPRMTTWGHTSSGTMSDNQAFYNSIHTPVLIITGTADSLGANVNGKRDYDNISKRADIPIMMFSKVGADHGGDLWAQNGGHFTKIHVAWLNWWLKGDETATGKGMLVGAGCPYCSDNTWQIQSAHLP